MWEFIVASDVTADLKAGSTICVNKHTLTLAASRFSFGATHCDLSEHIDIRTVAKPGDTFTDAAC